MLHPQEDRKEKHERCHKAPHDHGIVEARQRGDRGIVHPGPCRFQEVDIDKELESDPVEHGIEQICNKTEDRERNEGSREIDVQDQQNEPDERPLKRQHGRKAEDRSKGEASGNLTRSLSVPQDLEEVPDEFQPKHGMLQMVCTGENRTLNISHMGTISKENSTGLPVRQESMNH